MSNRPGSREARQLFKSPIDIVEWNRCLDNYDDAVACVSNGKSKPDLVKWDKYLWNKLVVDVKSREPRHITLSELADVMRWKLARGKARPLQKLVESNTNALVVKASTEAFKLLETGKWEKAIVEITSLKGVGVATATAIFAPFDSTIPFMADETMDAAISKRDYTMKVYRELRDALLTKARELQTFSAVEGANQVWDAEKVGKTLWVKAMMQVYPDIAPQVTETVSYEVPSSASVINDSVETEQAEAVASKASKRKAPSDSAANSSSGKSAKKGKC